MNLCRACNRDFGSLWAFDSHRVGKHAYTFSEGLRMGPLREDGRRCLDESELIADGWRQDRQGRWRTPSRAVVSARGKPQDVAKWSRGTPGRVKTPRGSREA